MRKIIFLCLVTTQIFAEAQQDTPPASTNPFENTKKEIEKELEMIKEEKKKFQEALQKEKELQETRINQLKETLEKMESKKAAKVLESMDKDIIVQLYGRVPLKQMTKIFENMTPQKVTEFMEYHTRQKTKVFHPMLQQLLSCQIPTATPPTSSATPSTPPVPPTSIATPPSP